ncbi:hypothetical protein [Streptomyces justiciae]|uniref:hypothetical protein n=1 Tax=Streptomyces justiciae TaxID=2780140 RepID=UPI00187E38FD|nr:hypothetical protein [Streptomyces justiciae]MBE8473263.1 hypothetical protein [Streptomyces justiciae]
MDVYEDPATWTAEPVRPRGLLTARFIATVLVMPVLWVFWLAVILVTFAVGMVTEVIVVFSTSYENGLFNLLDRATARMRLPSWGVTWPELIHEGDTAYYKARVEREVRNWTTQAQFPRDPKKFRRVMECEIPMRHYRGIGGWYVAQVALAQGWELRPTDVRKEVRLWWSAAS